ncbi:hypothetical protein MIF8_29 [Erwinia phage MIF8]
MQFPIYSPVMDAWATIPDEIWLDLNNSTMFLADIEVRNINMNIVQSDMVNIEFIALSITMHFTISKEKLQRMATRTILGLPAQFTTEVITCEIYRT